MKKNLIIGLLVFILLIILAGYYINTIFLPVQLKQYVLNKAQQRLNDRPITIEAVHFSPLRGLVLKNLTVYRKDDNTLPLTTVKETHVSIPLPTILKRQKIIIPSITIKEPYLHLIRKTKSKWNFTDLIKTHKDKAKKSPPFILGHISIEDAKLDITDSTQDPQKTIHFQELNIGVGLSLTEGIKFDISSKLSEQKSIIDVNGHYDLMSRKVTADVSLENLLISQFLPLFPTSPNMNVRHYLVKNSDLNISYSRSGVEISGHVLSDADLDITSNKTFMIKGGITLANLAAQGKGEKWDISSNLSTNNAQFRFGEKTILGDLHSAEIKMSLQQDQAVDLSADFILENGHVQIGDIDKVSGNLTAKNFTLKFIEGNADIAGEFELSNARAQIADKLQVTGHIKTHNIDLSFHKKQLKLIAPFSLSDTQIDIGQHTKMRGNFHSDNLKVEIAKDQVNISGQIMAEKSEIAHLNKSFTGTPIIKGVLDYDMTGQKNVSYSGDILFTSGELKGIPKLDVITNLNGNMTFDDKSIETKTLKFISLQTPAELTGTYRNYKNPSIVFRLESKDADLEALSSLYGPFLSKHGLSLKGKAAFFVSYAGMLETPEEAEEKVVINLKNTALQGENLPANFDNIYGRIAYEKNATETSINWDNLRFAFKEREYTGHGHLNNLSRPIVETTISSEDLNLETTFKILNKAFTIVSLEGTYLNSPFDVRGEIHLKEKGNPELDLRGRININLSDLTSMTFLPSEKIKPFNPAGTVDIEYLYRGNVKDWQKATAVISAESFETSIKNLKFQNVAAKLEQGDRQYTHLDTTASFYDGQMQCNILFDPKRENLPFKLTTQLEGTNLKSLKNDTRWRKKTMAGTLNGNISLAGPIKNSEEFVGSGALSIREGNIWEFKLLKGLWSQLLIDEFQHIVFTDGDLNFIVKDRRFMTDDLLLKGNAVDLKGHGWVGFDKKINFEIQPNFKKSEIIRSKDIFKSPSAILSGAEDLIHIKITGTLGRPRYEKTVMPHRIFEDATEVLKDGVGNILEELFDKLD